MTTDRSTRIEQCVGLFRDAVRDHGLRMSGDQRVSEEDAARLLGKEPGSLKNMRAEGRAPRHCRAGVGGGRISYRLSDLAEWLEDHFEEIG